MNDEIFQLKGGDFEEAMDFLNLVFSAYSPHDFKTMLPSIYRPTDAHMECNFAIKTEGRIRAIVGLFPILLRVDDIDMRIAGIGGVSTHPDHRTGGYMRSLMRHCVEVMRSQNYELSWLGGQRQRYLYFGYESCGTRSSFTVSKTNLRHSFDHPADITFAPMSAYDSARVARALELHNGQTVYCARPDTDFYHHLVGWHNKPYAALDGHGHMVGYLVANREGTLIAELCADSTDAALSMVRGWVEQSSEDSVTVELHAVPDGLLFALGHISEQARITESGNWQVFDWATTVGTLMRLKQRGGGMVAGEVLISIEGYGGLRLSVSGGEASCTPSDSSPDITCDGPTAKRLLFGPIPPGLVMTLPERATILESWCPLPLSLTRQDWV